MMLPVEFKNRMEKILNDEYEAFLKSYDKSPCKSLRFNTLKGKDILSEISDTPSLQPVAWCESGYYFDDQLKPGKHPYHEAGLYYIQEASAMLPAVLLDAKPGEKVLDLCAAPGGKSTQIAMQTNGDGLLICNEIVPSRAKILSENIERMGIQNAIVTNCDSDTLANKFPNYFDKIMVDAPCSGEGMFRKNPEACAQWSLENVMMCANRGLEILENAASMLTSGGRIVYSTCTFAPEENEGTIYRFLKNHPEFSIVKPTIWADGFEGGHLEWIKDFIIANQEGAVLDKKDSVINENHFVSNKNASEKAYPDNEIALQLKDCIRLFPHKVNGEGHFACILEKRSDNFEEFNIKTEKSLYGRDLKDYLSFEQDFLTTHFDGTFTKFGDQLYVLPKNSPALKGLKVLRPGLHLGTFLKNRFQPSHALALALSPSDVKNVAEISMDMAIKYINGETFSYQGDKGWYLITLNGFALGFGKLAGGIMKNHYPKGLRKDLS